MCAKWIMYSCLNIWTYGCFQSKVWHFDPNVSSILCIVHTTNSLGFSLWARGFSPEVWIGWFTARAAQRSSRRAKQFWIRPWFTVYPSKTWVPSSNLFHHILKMLVSLTVVFVFLSFTWNDTLQSKGEKLERWLHNRLKRQKSLRISLRPIWDLICLVYGEIDFSSLFSEFLSPKYAKSIY